ncbi:MAG: NAD-dependent epimerase/dehydratase family protein [Bernardetiaceae bacterium]|nr:NAD-dependent epimerase/dehydratase family protein [Bernardetiaceae bacterium]
MRKDKFLIIGASGQIGTELTESLRNLYSTEQVIASDIRAPHNEAAIAPFEVLDICDAKALANVVQKHQITQIYHLAAILSAKGEANPLQSWNINMQGLLNVLEIAKEKKLHRIYFPSSIAVFGPNTPSPAPQDTVMQPLTVYGISKAAGENWCAYYHKKYGVDVRGLRYPGLIGYKSLPGGGTTDYAVDIYHKALAQEPFECFLNADTKLPMMYMADAIRATIELMHAPTELIKIHHAYNVAAMSFAPKDIVKSVRKYKPDLEVSYKPDFREQIAKSWVDDFDDKAAQNDWNWKPEYDLDTMTQDMLKKLPQYFDFSINTEETIVS